MTDSNGIVALLTDFGVRDHYVGVVKGVILSVNPDARLVDISHEVSAQDVAGAYFLLQNAYGWFPRGTLFVAIVDPGVGTERAVLFVETSRHFFLAPDNGLVSFLQTSDSVRSIRRVTNRKLMLPGISSTFHGRDIFAPVAGHLSMGLDPSKVGPPVKAMRTLRTSAPRVEREGVVVGEVASVDTFGNLITNIPVGKLLEADGVEVRVGRKSLRGLSETYARRPKGTLVAVPGSGGMLEIAVSGGSAAKSLGAKPGDIVRVRLST